MLTDLQTEKNVAKTWEPSAAGDAVAHPSQQHRSIALLGAESPGVRRIEVISSQFQLVDRVVLFFAVFLVAYAYGLDGMVRGSYQVWQRIDCTH